MTYGRLFAEVTRRSAAGRGGQARGEGYNENSLVRESEGGETGEERRMMVGRG